MMLDWYVNHLHKITGERIVTKMATRYGAERLIEDLNMDDYTTVLYHQFAPCIAIALNLDRLLYR